MNHSVMYLVCWFGPPEKNELLSSDFSAYPQSYMTGVGEYLLTLSQQLELLAERISSDAIANEAQPFAINGCSRLRRML